MSYARKKALGVRLALLAEAPGTNVGGKLNDPWPALKAKLDKAFSELVRRTYADDDGIAKCITCEKTGPWITFDNGHFVPRNNLNTRWDIDNCAPQCPFDNRRRNGRLYEFGQAINKRLGPGNAERLIAKGGKPAADMRDKAPALLIEIRRLLKIQRKRFK